MGWCDNDSDIPEPPNYAEDYQAGIDVFLKNYMNLLNKEQEARGEFDPQRIAWQQALQEAFGPTQVRQQLDALKQFDPESFAVRGALSERVLGDLESGYELGPEYSRQIEQSVRGAQSARGNIYGNAPASAEAAVKGKAALDMYQQRLSNAGAFLSGPTPTQQSLAIQGVQPDRSMAYVTPTAGNQGVNFGLQNYQNLLAQQQLVGNQPNQWATAAGGAASGAAAGSAFGPWGAVVGAGVGGIAGYYSSSKVKRDIVHVGTSSQGIGIYQFKYKRGKDRYRGVIAEELLKSHPEAVGSNEGVLYVRYDLIDVPFEKECVGCGTFKPLEKEFYRRHGGKDGFRSECKQCNDVNSRAWKAAHPERTKVGSLERSRRSRAKHPEKTRVTGRKSDRKRQARKTIYMRERRRNNMSFRLASNLRATLSATLSGRFKNSSALTLLGCPIQDFRIYLESKFEPGMSWDNYGMHGWHVDHIMPLAIFDLTDPEHQKRAFHFSNMQPLWAADNISKSDKPPVVHQFSFL